MTKKQLAKTNKKMTMYLRKLDQQQGEDEVMMEQVEDLQDDATLERKRLVAGKDKEWANMRMITSLLRDLTGQIPGRAVAMGVLEGLVESAWSRLEKVWWDTLVEETWGFLKDNKALQRIIRWRMTNQVQEERRLVSTMERQERLQRHHQAQLK